MNSKVAESKPRTNSVPAKEFETVEPAGTASCPKLRAFYQAVLEISISKICVSDIEKLNDLLS